MESKIIGELFRIEVYSPIIRKDVREILKKQLEFKSLLQSDGLTEGQALLEISDIYEVFFSNISEEDKNTFEKIHAEEVLASPPEWFSLNINNTSNIKNVGELHGIQVVYPFTRDNIRDIVLRRTDLMKSLAENKNITIYQASNDLDDIQNQFIQKFGFDDQEKFYNLMADELNAHANALNDETDRINQSILKEEISQNNTTQIMAGIIVFCSLLFFVFVFFK